MLRTHVSCRIPSSVTNTSIVISPVGIFLRKFLVSSTPKNFVYSIKMRKVRSRKSKGRKSAGSRRSRTYRYRAAAGIPVTPAGTPVIEESLLSKQRSSHHHTSFKLCKNVIDKITDPDLLMETQYLIARRLHQLPPPPPLPPPPLPLPPPPPPPSGGGGSSRLGLGLGRYNDGVDDSDDGPHYADMAHMNGGVDDSDYEDERTVWRGLYMVPANDTV